MKLDIQPTNVITNEGGQLRSCIGPKAVDALRLRTMIGGLKLEQKGMKISRGVSCLKLAKEATGLKTNNRDTLIARLEVMLKERVAECVVVTDGE